MLPAWRLRRWKARKHSYRSGAENESKEVVMVKSVDSIERLGVSGGCCDGECECDCSVRTAYVGSAARIAW